MLMMDTTVVFTVHDRPELLRESLQSWSMVRNLNTVSFAFFVEPTPVIDEQLETIEKFRELAGTLGSFSVIQNPKKLGVLENPFQALSYGFDSGSQFVILAEEDIAVSEDVIWYFDHARQKMTDKTGMVLASNRGAKLNPEHEAGITWDYVFDPLVWGLRADHWPLVRDTWDHDYSQNGWDWNLNLNVIPQNGLHSILPMQSRSLHLGEIGTHMQPDQFRDSQADSFVMERPIVQYWMNEEPPK